MDKVFLFDIVTKLYFATDYVPTDSELFSICSDMLDIYMDFSCIYGSERQADSEIKEGQEPEPYEVVIRLSDKKSLLLQQISK